MPDRSVVQGAEPFAFDGDDTGVLVCHGFTGTPQSMRPLGEALAHAGATVRGPLLPGHGISVAAMAETGARDWTGAVERSLQDLRARCSRVFVAGLSMGGTLALYLAARHAGAIAGIITVNAVVELAGVEIASLALDHEAPATVPGIGSDIKDPAARELAYPEVPVRCFAELFALVGVTRALLPLVTCRALIMTSREDHVVPPVNGDAIARGIASDRVERMTLENSYHVATLDHDRALLEDAAVRFVRTT